jgi:hypothetical protein
MAQVLPVNLLEQYKNSIGDSQKVNNPLDDYYKNFLSQAYEFILGHDISVANASSENGKACVILIAQDLQKGLDFTQNRAVLNYLQLLNAKTRGDNYVEE